MGALLKVLVTRLTLQESNPTCLDFDPFRPIACGLRQSTPSPLGEARSSVVATAVAWITVARLELARAVWVNGRLLTQRHGDKLSLKGCEVRSQYTLKINLRLIGLLGLNASRRSASRSGKSRIGISLYWDTRCWLLTLTQLVRRRTQKPVKNADWKSLPAFRGG